MLAWQSQNRASELRSDVAFHGGMQKAANLSSVTRVLPLVEVPNRTGIHPRNGRVGASTRDKNEVGIEETEARRAHPLGTLGPGRVHGR